ncbi:hypothetical protein BJ508DRAFT_420033 [Ascobolus immersus RN42]|uniref:Uncharacterized protein n=1 Tax=Ascobolus immersus RN42 TaxID=1160509 RepID=A0A3N4HBA2_ASCIM|nr:hypothetical protein BJ508DRAFT_420033 [Ascobolus immersus RN42]
MGPYITAAKKKIQQAKLESFLSNAGTYLQPGSNHPDDDDFSKSIDRLIAVLVVLDLKRLVKSNGYRRIMFEGVGEQTQSGSRSYRQKYTSVLPLLVTLRSRWDKECRYWSIHVFPDSLNTITVSTLVFGDLSGTSFPQRLRKGMGREGQLNLIIILLRSWQRSYQNWESNIAELDECIVKEPKNFHWLYKSLQDVGPSAQGLLKFLCKLRSESIETRIWRHLHAVEDEIWWDTSEVVQARRCCMGTEDQSCVCYLGEDWDSNCKTEWIVDHA